MSRRRRSAPLVVEALEPRILYSADASLLVTGGIGAPQEGIAATSAPLAAQVQATTAASGSQTQQRHEVVFIDAAVEQGDDIAKRIVADKGDARTLDVYVIAAGTDGIAQIAEILGRYQDLDAVHIISHGASGELRIGDARLNSDSLLANAVAVSKWGNALTADGDILLYGCDVAADQGGRDFVAALSQLTGADVNASTDLTGATADGGDWKLEYAAGHIESALALNAAEQAWFNGVLATYAVTNTNDAGAGSLRQAIINANASSGADIITFSVGSGAKSITLSSALPTIVYQVTLDATTQTGYGSVPLIELIGINAGSGADGLSLTSGASGSIIKGFVINQFKNNGITLTDTSNVTIQGNYIGTNKTGASALGNLNAGISVSGTNNTIGGTTAAARNIISGNGVNGIRVSSGANLIQGNYIGTNAAGLNALGNGGNGILLASEGNTVGGTAAGAGNLVSGNGSYGIYVNAGNNLIQGNYIGTDDTGKNALGNVGYGIWLAIGSNNTVGGTAAGAGNLISGNKTDGVFITSSNNTVQGNYIGVDVTGSVALGNAGNGIVIHGSSNTIGGATESARNIISGNGKAGVTLPSAGTPNNTIQGNYIGLNATGTAAIGNDAQGIYIEGNGGNTITGNVVSGNDTRGIEIKGGIGNILKGNLIGLNAAGTAAIGNGSFGIYLYGGANTTTIGGSAAGEGNTVVASGSDGIKINGSSGIVIQGNYIGTNAAGNSGLGNARQGIYLEDNASNNLIGGTGAGQGNIIAYNTISGIAASSTGISGNRILANSIYSNGNLGIDLNDDGVTPNDMGDADGGPNKLLNFPVLTSAIPVAGTVTVSGTFNSTASRNYRIEFFANNSKDASGNGEGQIYLGYIEVTTDNAGNATISFSKSGLTVGQWISATATDLTSNDTSEFAADAIVNNPPVITSNGGGSSAAVSVAENTTAVTTVTATDADGNTLSFSISGGADAAKFAIDNATGALSFISAPNHEAPTDANGDNIYVVQVRVSDGNGGTFSQTINVTVTDVGSIVTNTNDAGAGSLRQAIIEANEHAGLDTITFNIGSGTQSISLQSALPYITDQVIIDGTSQTGYANAPIIVLNGASAGTSANGLTLLSGASGSTIKGLVINRFNGYAIDLNGTANVTIQSNYLGTDATGMIGYGGGGGIYLHSGNSYTTIGGSTAGAGNVISGNGVGIAIDAASNTTIKGNFIGVSAAGGALTSGSNGFGIMFAGGTNTTIGGTTAAERNVISGNLYGIVGAGISGTSITGNYFGTNATGTSAVANGVAIMLSGDSGTIIGSATAGGGNVISGNGTGIHIADSSGAVILGNRIGTNASGAGALGNSGDGIHVENGSAVGNNLTIGGTTAQAANTIAWNGGKGVNNVNGTGISILGNAIHSNAGLGIDLGNDGVTANDAGDADSGANDLQNFPVLTGATISGSDINITGTFNGMASRTYRIEFFANTDKDALGNGEGQIYLGYATVTTNASGNASFSVNLAGATPGKWWISATATDNSTKNTSEFAADVQATNTPVITSNGGGASAAVSMEENTTAVTTVTATDADGDTLVFSISGGADASKFTIDSSTGALKFVAAPNHEAPTDANGDNVYVVIVRVSDGSRTTTQTISITVTDVGCIVTNTNDAGAGSLRQAIIEANEHIGLDTITFNIGAGGLQSISLLSALPAITDQVIIDGTSQAGYVNVPIIELNGASAGASANGLYLISGASGSVIKGFVINRFGNDGILINGASNVTIQNNYIGTNAAGTAASANGNDGIGLASSNNNLIGGTTAAARNVISGNTSNGIDVDGGSSNNTIQGNYIGVNAAGTAALGNGSRGVYIRASASNNLVGGTAAGAGNVISGNSSHGIGIFNADTNNVQGNTIGLNAAGTAIIGNGDSGIYINGTSTNNTIGGTVVAARNVISGNKNGVNIASSGNLVQGNYIGTDKTGTLDLGNDLDGIQIYASANNNIIGGTAAGAGNLISGNNGNGISINAASGTIVQGNLVGTNAGGNAAIANGNYGLYLLNASGNSIGGSVAGARNVISGNVADGIRLAGATGNTVQGNYIGTDRTGTLDLGNGAAGIGLSGSATGNLIGGSTAGERNIISGNSDDGIVIINSASAIITGNYIGTDAAGTVAVANGRHGINIGGTGVSRVGGILAGEGNLISGNANDGIRINGVNGVKVQGNFIGTNAAGTASVANGGNGVDITGGASANVIGGTTAAERNIISGNTSHGIYIQNNSNNNLVQGNYIGVDVSGNNVLKNNNRGIQISASSNNTIGGTAAGAGNVISGNGYGVQISDGNGNIIQGNHIGTNAAGNAVLGNTNSGVNITGTSAGNTIGGTTAAARNIISGNTDGILLSAAGNTIQGNYIGTDASGMLDLGNTNRGIRVIIGGNDNTIGGTAAGAGNLISGNGGAGIEITTATGTTIQGNIIGTNKNGNGALANGTHGISLINNSNTTIGGSTAGARNLISGNAVNGIQLSDSDNNTIQGNYIGIDAAGTAKLANGDSGIYLQSGSSGNLLGGTAAGAGNVISGNVNGLVLDGSSGNTIQGNYIGTNAAGTGGVRNDARGIWIRASSNNNVIGGAVAGARNVVSANTYSGIEIQSSTGTSILGNYIGVDKNGTAALGNGQSGIYVNGASANTTIGDASGGGNVISGNGQSGIALDGGTGNLIKGNIIGLNANGTAVLANGNNGILIRNHADNNTIGGSSSGEGNVIAGNSFDGIRISASSGIVIQGNHIGTNAAGDAGLGNARTGIFVDEGATGNLIGGTAAGQGNVIAQNTLQGIATAWNAVSGNRFLGNAIHSNGGIGIDLGNDGVTANDAGDGDAAGNGNGLQNFPVLAGAYVMGANTTILGSFNSTPSRTYRIEIYANASKDASGNGEGKIYIGYVDVTTDASGNASLSFTLTGISAGQWISATATDLTTNETSEFAVDVLAVPNDAPVITSNGGGASAAVTAYENGTTATIVTATDANGDTPTYTIIGGADGAKFAIDSATGALRFIAASDFEMPTDADGDNVYVVQVSVSDGKGGMATQTLSITVANVNEAPSGADRTVSVNEDASYIFGAADFGFSDASDSPANALLSVKITSLPTAGSLTLNGAAVTAGQFISVADINAGGLVFTPAANAHGANYAVFTFQVRDNGGTAPGVDLDPTARSFTFHVASVNDAPSGANNTLTIDEDGSHTFGTTDFGFGDIDGNALLSVKITSLPTAGSLTLNGSAVAAGQFISVADIAAGLLKFTPAANAHGANYASFTFQVQDNGGTLNGGVDLDPTPRSFTFHVASVNDAPSGANNTLTIDEDGSHTFGTTDFGFGDIDGNALLSVKITSLPTAGSLTLNGSAVAAGQVISVADIAAGLLKFTPAANAHGANYASFTFQVRDNGGTLNGGVDLDPTPRSFTFHVASVNDAPSGANNTLTIDEDGSHTFGTTDFGFGDIDGNALLSVKITSLPTAGSLTLNGSAVAAGQVISVADIAAGLLKFTPAANAHGANYASFTFQVQDNGGTANGGVDLDPTPRSFTFHVTAVNDAPSGTGNTLTIDEDATHIFTAADFGFADIDGNALLSVKITSLPTAGSLTLNGSAVTAGQFISVADIAAGLLKFTPAANAHGANYASFTFQVQDSGGTLNGGVDLDPTPRSFTFHVTSVNDAPSGTGNTLTIDEDGSHTFGTTDFGFGDIDGNALLSVKITSLPTAGSLTLNGSAVAAGQFISAADIAAGLLKFTPAANAHGANYASFTFQVRDDGGTPGADLDPTPRSFTFHVTAVNDAPSGTGNTLTINEDGTHIFTAADFGFADIDGNALLSVKITSLPTAGSLTLNGSAVTAGQFISAADIAAGLLKFTPAANAHGANYASFTFQVRDDGGTPGADLDPTPRSFTFHVTAVNDAPSGTGNTLTIDEDATHIFTAADFGFADIDGNALLSVKITSLPTAGSLTLNGSAVTAGQFISVADIAAGLLKFTPAANAHGANYASFTFQVQDSGGTLNGGVDLDPTARSVTFHVTAVNDAPSGANNTLTINEDGTHIFTAADFGFADIDGNSLLAVRITSLPTAGSLTLNGNVLQAGDVVTLAQLNGGLLKFTPAANAHGANYASFTFQVQDSGGTLNGGVDLDPTPRSFTFHVTSVNDAPSGTGNTLTIDEDATHTFSSTDFGFADIDGNALLSVKITSLPTAGSLTLNGSAVTAGQFISAADIAAGLLKFTPAANAHGANYASFTFQVQDSGGTLNGGVDLDPTARSVTFHVTAVNDAPSGANNTLTINEDGTHIFTAADFGFADIDGNALLSVKITSLPTAGSLTLNGSAVTAGQFISAADIAAGLLKFTPAANAHGANYASFTFQVRDDGGTPGADLDPTPRSFTFHVTAVNDAPSGTGNTLTIDEDGTHTFTAADFGFADIDGNSLLAVRITSLPTAGSLTLNGNVLQAGDVVTLAQLNGGLLKFTPAANAHGANYASFTFQVQDNGGTAPGADLDPTARSVTFHVTAVNDAPSGTGNTLTIDEDGTHTFTAADFGFADIDGNALLSVKITSLPTAGSLTLNGSAVAAGQFISAADIAAGLLKFTPAANAHGANYASFTFQVQDNGGTAPGADLDPTARSVTFHVTAVNDAPSGTGNTLTIDEDGTHIFTAADFGFADIDGNALLSVKITSLPTAGSLTLNGSAVAAGQFISAADIAAGLLKFTPAANAHGANYASFTFQVRDDGGTAPGADLDPTARSVTFHVTAVNDAPSGTGNTLTIDEDGTHTFTAADFGFADIDGNSLLAVRITSLPTAGSLTLNGSAVTAGQVISVADIAAGLLKFTPAANAHGANYASFTFQVQDSGGTLNGGVDLDPTPRSFTFHVASVNDAPSGTGNVVTVYENMSHVFTVADFGFSDSSDSPANGLLAIKITTLPTAGSLTLNGVAVTAGQFIDVADIAAGKLVFTPVANANGAGYAGFTFQVQDNGGTAGGDIDLDPTPRTITIDVREINHAPAGADNTVVVLEDNSYTFAVADFGFADPDGDALLAVRITNVPGTGTLTLNGLAVANGQVITAADIAAGKLKFTPAANAHGANYASFTFQVQDDGDVLNGGVDLDPTARTLTINVTPVNDAPSGADGTVATSEDVAYTFTVTDFGFADADGHALQAIRITTLPQAGTLTLNGVAVNAGDFITLADIKGGRLTFTPVKDASGAGYASFTFQVQDDGGTADGGVDLDPVARAMTVNVAEIKDASDLEDETATTPPDNNGNKPAIDLVDDKRNDAATTEKTGSTNAAAAGDGTVSHANVNPSGSNELAYHSAPAPSSVRVSQPVSDGESLLSEQHTVAISLDHLATLQRVAAKNGFALLVNADLRASDDGDNAIGRVSLADGMQTNTGVVSPQTIELAAAATTLGTVWMVVRKGALAASLLASMPAWVRLDPLPVLLASDDPPENEGDDGLDIADHMFSEAKGNTDMWSDEGRR
ncbi:DUF4347 domain-containing protein [Noviherbaspirillum cavernae]|uniref:DUF4347 domain-containing protein n=1 Tax=Noviherbaspirillum cavernae TaxID=2320862 RepID=A0A418WVS0_9BURK|nr:cadherin-like domain-containing protein [Noviherbaspirillum cavernae]RJF96743.1 DUF4347 domain-containing protein [Noviherbaspirillum cavernae]